MYPKRTGYPKNIVLGSLILLAVLLSLHPRALAAQAVEDGAPTTLILVRHAEKASDGTRDPALTPEGTARAERLAELLADAGIDAVYSTPYQRTRQTAAPTAEALGQEVVTYKVQGEALADTLLRRHPGQKVLVVGHSNTVPQLLNALVGEERFEWLREQEFDALFVVSASERGAADVTLLRYGH